MLVEGRGNNVDFCIEHWEVGLIVFSTIVCTAFTQVLCKTITNQLNTA